MPPDSKETKLASDAMSHMVVRVKKMISRTHTFLSLLLLNEMAIFSKVRQPVNVESHNSLKRSFTNIQGLRSYFVGYESFLQSNPPDILVLCGTKLEGPIDSRNFCVKCYLPSMVLQFV